MHIYTHESIFVISNQYNKQPMGCDAQLAVMGNVWGIYPGSNDQAKKYQGE